MTFTGDERAQSVQVGAVLLFGVLIIAFSSYQAFAVPEQNREVEFNHNQQVQTQMQDLRNAIVSVPGQPSRQAVSVQLGTQYPSRLVATNPGPPSGLLYTDGTDNESRNLTVRNAEAVEPETVDYWNGTPKHYNTGAIAYKPEYNVYGAAPETVYEHSVVYNQFREGDLTLSDQAIVDGREITLVALNGSMSRSASGSVAVDIEPKSQSSRTVRVTNATDTSNVSVSFLSRRPASEWNETLSDQQYVADVTPSEGPGSLYGVTIVFERGVTYRLQMAKAGVGTGATDESEAYLTTVGDDDISVEQGDSEEIVLEVRDAYNNPVSNDVSVNGSDGSGALTTNTETPDSDGQVTFEYQANQIGTNQVNFSVQDIPTDRVFDDGTPENVSVTVDVTSGSGSGGNNGNSERIGLAYNNDAVALDYNGDGGSGGLEYTFTNTYDQQVEITDIGITTEATNVESLHESDGTAYQQGSVEIYISGDTADGFVEAGTDNEIPIPNTVDIVDYGIYNNDYPQTSGGSTGTVSLSEFGYEAPGFFSSSYRNVDISGKKVTQTITYTLQDGETQASAFTVTGDYSESNPDIRPPIADFGTVKHNSNGNNNDEIQFNFRVADKSGIDSVEMTAIPSNGNSEYSETLSPSSGSSVDYALDLGKDRNFNGGKTIDVTITIVDSSPNRNTHICEGTISTADTDLIDERGLRCRTP